MKTTHTGKPALFLLTMFFFVSASAFSVDYIVDNAGLLSPSEIEELTGLIESVSRPYEFDLIIVTERSIGNANPEDYAYNFFINSGYGLGEGRNGCLFLQVTDTEDFWFSPSGRGVDLMNDAAWNKLQDDVVKFLEAEAPYRACRAFILDWEQFLALEAKGRSYNVVQRWNTELMCAAWITALVIALIVIMIWKKGMDTAISQKEAAAYIIPGSLSFKMKKDRFLYSTVTKTKRPKNEGSGGGYRSSGGGTRGGRGGRY